MNVTELLRAKNWPALVQHFASQDPVDASQYHARALLALNDRSGPMDWQRILSDLRRACELQPQEPLLRINLAQALLECRQPEEAYKQSREACRLAPQLFPALEKLSLAAVATGRLGEALQVLQHAAMNMPAGQALPAASAGLLAQLATQWWLPVSAGGASLRQPARDDAQWLGQLFQDAAFMRQYHRSQAANPKGLQKLLEAAALPPFQTRRIDWIVRDRSGAPRGLAALVDIDWPNRRAELLIGFPGTPQTGLALRAATAALSFAFHGFGLQKVVSYVYADNPRAQTNALHLGFRSEGLLRSHMLAQEQRIDLHVNGLLREEWLANPMLAKLAGRWRKPQ